VRASPPPECLIFRAHLIRPKGICPPPVHSFILSVRLVRSVHPVVSIEEGKRKKERKELQEDPFHSPTNHGSGLQRPARPALRCSWCSWCAGPPGLEWCCCCFNSSSSIADAWPSQLSKVRDPLVLSGNRWKQIANRVVLVPVQTTCFQSLRGECREIQIPFNLWSCQRAPGAVPRHRGTDDDYNRHAREPQTERDRRERERWLTSVCLCVHLDLPCSKGMHLFSLPHPFRHRLTDALSVGPLRCCLARGAVHQLLGLLHHLRDSRAQTEEDPGWETERFR
jgi:hypothetical protein